MNKSILCLGFSLYAVLGCAQNEQKLVFDFASPRQTIHSFGASDCWRVQYIGKNWPLEKRNQIADLLFSSEFDSWGNPKGIGLSMWRFNIGSGSHEAGDNGGVTSQWRRTECFLGKEGDWDWDKQKGQRWMLQAARERGVRYSLGFSITAPYFMTKNEMARASEKTPYANIRENQFDDYAAFLAEVSTHLKLDYLSPINEPQWEWVGRGQEGMQATNAECSRLIHLLDKELQQRHSKTKVVFGEAADIRYLYRSETDKPERDNQLEEIFPKKRVYQGSSGSVYPYPVVEKIEDEKHDRPWRAFFIENEYIKLMILPELGGRIQMAYDKVKKRHFVYYNQVIKPALVGLTGPWISGGIEFNWPQHHRPSTYLPTDCMIEEFPDGSKTIWCSEVERMFRTKGMAGFTLYPGKAYIEIKAKVYNRTPFPQTFLWWANPAVVVNKDYYSVFPPDVNAVFDHGKRAVSSFPIATGEYYKVDYSAGVDISRYKNIPVPTSYMAINSKFDFVGGYEEHIESGLLHVADHHVNAGKKQWTWGHGDFGQAWDRNLTDEDGPYIELMTGMYCDNQPDFTWLQPYEEKSWVQYFMPYQKVGMVKNATRDALINMIPEEGGKMKVILYTTAAHKEVRVMLTNTENGKIYLDALTAVAPDNSYINTVDCDTQKMEELKLTVLDEKGKVLVSYQAAKPEIKPIPEPAKAALDPKKIASMEQLFLTGHHLEQYRHATYLPMDYYMEALSRDESDIRCNNAVGLLLMRRGRFAEAQKYFDRAIKTQTERNPNPYEGEPYYNLGWSKKMQGDIDGAYDAFFKATWNAAWQDSGYMGLAQIDMIREDYTNGLDHIDRSLYRNWLNHKGRQLKVSFLRKTGDFAKVEVLINDSLAMDKFNMGCRFESYLIHTLQGNTEAAAAAKAEMKALMRGAVHSYLEYAIDYASAGMYEEATQLLSFVAEGNEATYPMVYYALGYFASKMGKKDEALNLYKKAETMCPDYCFPNKLEEVLMLNDAMSLNPEGAKAPYYLGNFHYAARIYDEAIACWEKSASIDDTYPTVLRNLSLAYYNKQHNPQKALATLEKAYNLDTTDARILMELDQLYKKLRYPHRQRLDFLEAHADVVEQRDDLCIERITLYNQLGEYQKAYDLINSRKFHPWEGGEGKVTSQYLLCRVELAKIAIREGRFADAVRLLKETEKYPDNLGEGKLSMAEENDIHYWMGCAYEGLGEEALAKEYFTKATKGSAEPAIAFFYNDQQPDKIFYQGLAWRKLGEEDKARSRFNRLIKHGEKHLFDKVKIDYFAVSLPDLLIWDDDLNIRNQIHCNLVMGMGYLGLGDKEQARKFLSEVVHLDINHQVGVRLLAMCE